MRVNTVLFGEPRLFNRGIPSCGDACRSVETVRTGSVIGSRVRHYARLTAEQETVRTVLTSEGTEASGNDWPARYGEW